MEISRVLPVTAIQPLGQNTDPQDRTARDVRSQVEGVSADKRVSEQGAAVVQQTASVEYIESLREKIAANSREQLKIDREEESGKFIYRLLDPETGEVTRQWPPEEYLDLVAFLKDQQGGRVDQRV